MIPLGVLASARHAAGGGGVDVIDSFTDTGSLALTSHVADTGQSWATDSTDWVLHYEGDKVLSPNGYNARAWVEFGSPDMEVSVTLVYTGSGSAQAGIMARYDPTAGTGYVAQVNTSTVYLYRFDGTSTSLITSAAFAMSHPTTIAIEVDGTGIMVTADGTTVITTTDAAYTVGNYGGLFQVTARSLNRYDDFAITAP